MGQWRRGPQVGQLNDGSPVYEWYDTQTGERRRQHIEPGTGYSKPRQLGGTPPWQRQPDQAQRQQAAARADTASCTLACPHCGKSTAYHGDLAGRVVRCPHCRGQLKIPHKESELCRKDVSYPVLENATNEIDSLPVSPHSEYLRLSLEERRNVFTVEGIEDMDTLAKIKGIAAECFVNGEDERDFERKIKRAFGKTLVLSETRIEKAFRGTVNRALTAGLLKTVGQQFVTSGFPYLMFSAIRDDRAAYTHLALEQFGLDGTNIYRRDDPLWQKFMPPLTDLCRCGVTMLTTSHAAELGVKEAQEWSRTGQPPQRPQWVKMPAFDPRLDLEDEWPDCLEDPQALRARLVKEMHAAPSTPHGRGLPRNVLRRPLTTEEGLALLQGRAAAVYTLPPLAGYFDDMNDADMKGVPPWKGEPENDREYLETLDAIIACHLQAKKNRRRKR